MTEASQTNPELPVVSSNDGEFDSLAARGAVPAARVLLSGRASWLAAR